MISFALDGSHRRISLALFRGNSLIYDISVLSESLHSRMLTEIVDFAFGNAGMDISQIERVYCGIGPGRYTSLRVSVAFVKGLFFNKDVDVFAVNSLDLIAAGVPRCLDEVCVFSEIYSGYVRYRKYRLVDGIYRFFNGGRTEVSDIQGIGCFCVGADERLGIDVCYPEARNVLRVVDVLDVTLDTLKPEY